MYKEQVCLTPLPDKSDANSDSGGGEDEGGREPELESIEPKVIEHAHTEPFILTYHEPTVQRKLGRLSGRHVSPDELPFCIRSAHHFPPATRPAQHEHSIQDPLTCSAAPSNTILWRGRRHCTDGVKFKMMTIKLTEDAHGRQRITLAQIYDGDGRYANRAEAEHVTNWTADLRACHHEVKTPHLPCVSTAFCGEDAAFALCFHCLLWRRLCFALCFHCLLWRRHCLCLVFPLPQNMAPVPRLEMCNGKGWYDHKARLSHEQKRNGKFEGVQLMPSNELKVLGDGDGDGLMGLWKLMWGEDEHSDTYFAQDIFIYHQTEIQVEVQTVSPRPRCRSAELRSAARWLAGTPTVDAAAVHAGWGGERAAGIDQGV